MTIYKHLFCGPRQYSSGFLFQTSQYCSFALNRRQIRLNRIHDKKLTLETLRNQKPKILPGFRFRWEKYDRFVTFYWRI
jgi:hypothetical protein